MLPGLFSVSFSILRKPEPRLMFDNLLFFFFGKWVGVGFEIGIGIGNMIEYEMW
jgi:hypothetical protein